MALDLSVANVVGIAGGVLLIGLGALVLAARPTSSLHQFFFAFALTDGLSTALFEVRNALDFPERATAMHLYFLSFLLFAILLVGFALLFPAPTSPRRRAAIEVGLAISALVAVAVYSLDPSLFWTVRPSNISGFAYQVPGSLTIVVYLVGAGLVVARFGREAIAGRPEMRGIYGLVTMAVALAYVPDALLEVVDALQNGFAGLSPIATVSRAVSFGVGGIFVVVVGLMAWRSDARRKVLLSATIAAIAAIAFLSYAAPSAIATKVAQNVAFVAYPLLLGYTLARFKVFDLDLRLKRYVHRGAIASAFLGVFLAAGLLAQVWLSGIAGYALGGIAAVPMLVARRPLSALSERLAERVVPNVDDTPEYARSRRLQMYRAALAEAAAAGPGSDEARFADQLRKDLRITEEQDRILRLVAADAPPRIERASSSKFVIERELGSGAMGTALLAEDTSLRRKVVLKRPHPVVAKDPVSRERFLQEARVAARIQHPNVVSTYEVIPGEDPALVLEFVDGGSLESRLKRGRMSPREALLVGADIFDGLARIHREGIVHRDVKPANVLLTTEGQAKITDFGVASAPDEIALGTLSGEGFQPGSIAYMSPEQARGDPVGPASDVYSAALVVVEAVGGRFPIDLRGMNAWKARTAVQEARVAVDGLGLPTAARDIIDAAFSREPERRPPAVDVGSKLRAAALEVPTAAPQAAFDPTATLT